MVIDSHTLLWWLERSSELSDTARRTLDEAADGDSVFYVVAVSFWELYRKELRGTLKPKVSVRRWPKMLERLDWMRLIDDSPDIWLKMAELDWAHQDPADRLVATVALRQGVPVLTRDRRFHASDSPVKAVW
jgi:PIN domain nuclease of toxin-antitoxin system